MKGEASGIVTGEGAAGSIRADADSSYGCFCFVVGGGRVAVAKGTVFVFWLLSGFICAPL